MAKSIVVIFALIDQNKILIERRPIKGFLDPRILIPGGSVNSLENLEDALKREMMEELGIIPTTFELLTNEDIEGLHNNILKPFIVNSWQGEIPKIGMDKEDPFPLEWLEIDQVLNVQIKPTKKIVEEVKKYLSR